MNSSKRAGFSIMEVLLATSILLGCIIVLSELASLGRKHARSAEKLVNAQLLCEAKLNDILCGSEPLAPVSEKQFEENIKWAYSIDVVPAEIPGIVSLIVEVFPSQENESEASRSESENQPKTCRLIRWVPDSLASSDDLSEPNPGNESLFGGDE
jgi:general secretion pathway protein I